MPTTYSQNFKEDNQRLLSTMSHRNTSSGDAALAPTAKNFDQQVDSKQSDKDHMSDSNLANSRSLAQLQSQNEVQDQKSQDNQKPSDGE